MAFKTVKAWAQSEDYGRSWLTFFRKVPSGTATIAGQWFDYSTASGIPVPNYYASSPLVAEKLEAEKGVYVPEQTTKRYIKRSILMSAAASVTGTTNQNQSLMLLDYLLYYPFIDLDAVGEDQIMDNTKVLDRYEDGIGVNMMMVAQAPTVGGGSFTVTYIGSDDVEYTTETVFCPAAQPSGALATSVSAAAGVSPFIPLNINVKGVKSIVKVNVLVANGGLSAIVLVKPFQMVYVREEARRPTSSPTESYGDATETEQIIMRAGTDEIKPNAFLGWIGRGVAGSLASAPLVGMLETFWSE